MDILTNSYQNKDHYDEVFARVNIDSLITKVNNFETFLEDAIKTDTSWHGFYQRNFRNLVNGKRILELGAGDGLNAFIMAKLGGEVTTIDISETSQQLIEVANKRLGLFVQAMTGDFQNIDFSTQSFDFIVGKAFLHHLAPAFEKIYLEKIACLLKPLGEARFFEPATNSAWIDKLRWMIPVPGRPSILDKKSFVKWKEKDPHPERDNSTKHFIEIGNCYFNNVEIVLIGSVERLCRILPSGRFNRAYRRWAHRIEPKLPNWFRYSAARSQLIIYRNPK